MLSLEQCNKDFWQLRIDTYK